MKIKIDESLSRHVAGLCRAHGHDADTVYDEGINGQPDPLVLEAARSNGRMLFTADRGFGDVRHHPLGTHRGVIVFQIAHADGPAILSFIEGFLVDNDLEQFGRCLVIVNDRVIRVRRPAP